MSEPDERTITLTEFALQVYCDQCGAGQEEDGEPCLDPHTGAEVVPVHQERIRLAQRVLIRARAAYGDKAIPYERL